MLTLAPRFAVLGLVLAMSCGGGEDSGGFGGGTAGGGDTDEEPAPDYDCPEGMIEVEGGTISLGEGDESIIERYFGTIIATTTARLEPYCMATFPLPGRDGADWPSDGLGWSDVAELEAMLPAYGRRLCTTSELMLGAAGPDNWRYPYDNNQYTEAICDIESSTPSALGAYPDCVSALGFRDFMVRSSWGVLDPFVYASLRVQWDNDFPGDGVYGIYGGTSAQDTFFAASNYGIHFYGPGDDVYRTDGLRVCAPVGEPDAAVEAAWQVRLDELAASRSFADWLSAE
jgi:hypothetical protein